MRKTIGPTFGDEVVAAGLGGLPFTWTVDGDIQGRERLTKEQNAQLDTVVAVHDSSLRAKRKSEVDLLLDLLVAEGVVPSAKATAIAVRLSDAAAK